MLATLIAHLRRQWMGALALFLVLTSGAAYAANTVFSSDIVDNEVYSADVRDDSLAGGGLTAVDLKLGAVRSSEVLNDTETGGGLAAPDLRPGSVTSSEALNNSLTGADISESTLTLTGGGDVSGPLSNLQLGYGTVGRSELASGAPQGCCVFSDFEYSIPANACHIKTFAHEFANLGEIFVAFPESSDLGTGVYVVPTVVAHPGEVVLRSATAPAPPSPFPSALSSRIG
jgi:hypothetical protein